MGSATAAEQLPSHSTTNGACTGPDGSTTATSAAHHRNGHHHQGHINGSFDATPTTPTTSLPPPDDRQFSDAPFPHDDDDNDSDDDGIGSSTSSDSDDGPSHPDDDDDDHGTTVLLNVFHIDGRPHRCLYHGAQIVWEAIRPGMPTTRPGGATAAADIVAQRTVLPIADVIRVQAVRDREVSAASKDPRTPSQQPPVALLLHYACRRRGPDALTPSNVWRVRCARLQAPPPASEGVATIDGASLVRRWLRTVRMALRRQAALAQRPRRLLVFVNPFGGRRRALHIWERVARPLLRLAGVRVVRAVVTQRAGEIREALAGAGGVELAGVDGVVCVGGDGTVSEVFNGLVERAMWDVREQRRRGEKEEEVEEEEEAEVEASGDGAGEKDQRRRFRRPRLPIGIIPGGSTDTVAYCLHGTTDIRTAVVHIILGQRTGLDLASVSDRSGRLIRLYASVMSYGYLGDVAADSERFRWMGPRRYDYSGFKKFIANRGYEGEIAIPIETDDDDDDEDDEVESHTGDHNSDANNLSATDSKTNSHHKLPKTTGPSHPDDGVLCCENCSRCARRSLSADRRPRRSKSTGLPPAPFAEPSQATMASSVDTLATVGTVSTGLDEGFASGGITTSSSASSATSGSSGSLRERLDPRRWRILHGRFFMVNGANLSCACARSPNGFSKFSHVGDGRVDLVLVRHTSMVHNLRLLMKMASRTRRISELSFVEIHRVRCFHFHPIGNADGATTLEEGEQPEAAQQSDDDDGNVTEDTTTTTTTTTTTATTTTATTQSSTSWDTKETMPQPPDADESRRRRRRARNGGREAAGTSQWNCDGEVISDADVFVESHCQLVQVFRRGTSRPAAVTTSLPVGGLKRALCGGLCGL